VKGHLVKAIVDNRVSISIIILPIVKQLRLAISVADGISISFIRGVSFAIADAKVPVNLMIIDVLRATLLIGTDWLRRYSADLLFSKKKLVFENKK